MKRVALRTGAWTGDRTVVLTFPEPWDVQVPGGPDAPALDAAAMRAQLRAPIGTPRLADLARGRRRAVIIIDDISRPTPTAELLPLVLEELEVAGLAASDIRIVVAAGAHEAAPPEHTMLKIGAAVAQRIGHEVHDPDGDLVDAGYSPSGVPLRVNRTVMEADLKIGLGCIAPHDAAGFSGGSKILVPGVGGTTTARYLHDLLRGAQTRGEGTSNDFRRELDAITGALGLDFIVNVVLTRERGVAALVAGDRVEAHAAGAAIAARAYAVAAVERPDIVIANSYPYDASLWFVPWGLWPIVAAGPGATCVVIADGTHGAGGHRLKPTHLSAAHRAWLRLQTIRPRHLMAQLRHLAVSLRRTRRRQQLRFLLFCPNIDAAGAAARFPRAQLFRTWEPLLAELQRRHPGTAVRVAVYASAPLQIPRPAERGS